MMKHLCLLFVLATVTILPSNCLNCGEVTCPGTATTCTIKYSFADNPNRKINTVTCFNSFHTKVHSETYDTPDDDPQIDVLPIVECGGYQCKHGAYNCSTLTTPFLKARPPNETTHLICRDKVGNVIEERDIVRILSDPEASGKTPPTCEGHKCPYGSRSCTYDTVIQLEPYKKTAHVVCYDIKKRKTSEVNLNL